MTDFNAELEQKLSGATIHITRRESDWVFEFSTGLRLQVEAAWLMRNAQLIQLTDADDGHKYGLPAAIDAEICGNERLAGAIVSGARMDGATGDLEVAFSNGSVLEVLTNSIGYESWQAYLGKELWAVAGNGGLR